MPQKSGVSAPRRRQTKAEKTGRARRGGAPGLRLAPSLQDFRRRDERSLERPLELRTAEGLHHVTNGAELLSLPTRRIDAHAEDRKLREPATQTAGQPHPRASRRL